MSFFSWFKHEFICPHVRALNATIFVHSTPNNTIGKGYSAWRSQMSVFSWFKHEFICPYVRALNVTTFVRSTHNNSIGKDHYVWRLQISYQADTRTTPNVLMLERWMLPFSNIHRQTILFVRDIVHEDHKWVFLADLSTSSYVLKLERWMLPLSYVQRTTIVLVRTIMCEDCK